jgi:molybdate transport system substrate-binding protein
MAQGASKFPFFGLALFLGIALAMLFLPNDKEKHGPLVLAASSMQQALEDAATQWSIKGHPRPLLAFAGTPALAKQIEAGSRADIFISADAQWMDTLQSRNIILAQSRLVLAGNQLVMVVPKSDTRTIILGPGFDLAGLLGSARLSVADPNSVPAGKYAKAALEKLGVWKNVEGKIAPAENVRAALALVARGAAPIGIVYQSDIAANSGARIAARFPADSHPPITYPAAILARSEHADARPFLQWLGSAEGQAIFARHGFSPAPR